MRLIRAAAWPCAALLLAVASNTASAAWCNVMQVCCKKEPPRPAASYYPPVVSYYAPPASSCCPQPCCKTEMQARTYYEPVTRMETRTYYEPVTQYRTSYYYEPVTQYRTSYYYDPNTCSYAQTAVPTTSLQLRSQTCPVQSWVSRCVQVPVQSTRQVTYYEPVTTCATPPSATPPQNTYPLPPGAPGVQDSGAAPRVGDSGTTNGSSYLRRYLPTPEPVPGSSFRQPPPAPVSPPPPLPSAPKVRLEGIVSLPRSNNNVEGQVVRLDNQPQSGARVLFIGVDQPGVEQKATADQGGVFKLSLTKGTYRVYLTGADGRPLYQGQMDFGDSSQPFTLVSR